MRWLVGALLVLVLLAGTGGRWLYVQLDEPGPLPETAAIVVPRGTEAEIAEDLARSGVIVRPLVFRALALATFRRGPLHAGELLFPAQASVREVLTVLRTSRPVQHRLTIPEGRTAAQVATILDRAEALSGVTPVPEEGAVLPETYDYERGATREQLLDRARMAMDRALDQAWEARTPGSPLVSKEEALVLASIVEKETGKASERPLIAAVFLNRLRQGMRLQSDPTVVYGASGGLGSLGHPILRSELDHADPYNTYLLAGLPAAPICMPGLAAIRAVTQPAMSDALYFVADGTGGHAFARSQDDHLRNVARWRELERIRALPPIPVQQ